MIVVTGMHRSGTSLVAELLMELGIEFGECGSFLKADRWNARGYFESTDVIDANSRIITGFPRATTGIRPWLGKIVYTTMPAHRSLERRAQTRQCEIRRLAQKYCGKAVKDPRFCLTLGFWKKYARVESCVVCLREPRECVESLYRRQNYPPLLGFRFWNYHIEALLPELRGLRCLFVDYNRLLSGESSAELQRIGDFFRLELEAGEMESKYRRVCDPDLRHCRSVEETLPKKTRELWSRLMALAN